MWIQVANQLKLRAALRIVKADPTLAKQKAEEAAKGAILKQDVLINKSLSNEQTRMFEWGDSGMNANLTTILEGFQDPRLPLYMTKNQADVECEDGKTIVSGTQYLGIRGGCDLPAKPNQWGNFSKIVCSYTTALPVMMAAEGYFLRAEGALRGWSNMGGTAKELYEQGIRVSIKNQLAYKGSLAGVSSISETEIDAYISGTTTQKTSSTRLMVKTASRLRMILRLSGMRARLMRRNYNVSSHRNGLRTSRCLARLGRNFVVQVIRNYSRTA